MSDRVTMRMGGYFAAVSYYYYYYYQSINQSTRIYIAPYVAGESEARTDLG